VKKQPVIITAPHTMGKIPDKFRERVALSDFEIWQMHDPFTDGTCVYPRAFAIHKAESHRILGDLNRGREAEDLFRSKDFYGRQIWKDNQELRKEEEEEMLKQFWDPFRAAIRESFEEIKKEGFKKILFIDHHNTAVDHPAKLGQYLPPINLGNFGNNTGDFKKCPLSSSPESIRAFQKSLKKELPELDVEMNAVYEGSSLLCFIRDEIQPEFPECEIDAILLEYNLNLIFNPLSKNVDNVAKDKLHEGMNNAIASLIEGHFL
jgi:hypothetical protein